MRDLVNDIKGAIALAYGALAAGVGETIDLQGFDSMSFLFTLGALAGLDDSNSFQIVLNDADDDGTGNPGPWSVVTEDYILPTGENGGIALDINDVALANTVQKFGYVGSKRFVRIQVVENGAPGASEGGSDAILGHPNIAAV